MHQSRFKRFLGTVKIAQYVVMSVAIAMPTVIVVQRATATQLFLNLTFDDPCYWVTSSGQRVGLGQLCGNAPPKKTAPIRQVGKRSSDGIIRVPIKRRIASTPVIEVILNGVYPAEMIVDTGASSSLITQVMAQQLNIKPIRTLQAGIANGSVVQFPVARVRSMSAGGLTTNNLEVAIADQMDVGLLGHDFFGKYDIKIKRDVVEFYPQQ
ncbi:retropepsin-like aspartic protease family protein [Myxacorys almedinensis]|uniref:Aspartyl protease n=1 Tax=Myxacorys almedinensis A TaxID=2690445 RepID=A0A8J7Z3I8_9CYAN|nr:retropepsin-like aspartic protease [Myxacorys almedinensis]NDJ18640.1 aspartyl protease [Myxacorys almedinensis A]